MNIVSTKHRYRLLDNIGEGGYSTVYRAVCPIGIRYACKRLGKDKNTRLRVQNEIEIFKQISNNSIRVPRFVEACEDEGAYYIFQEYCKGGTANQYLSMRKEEYAENTVASIIRGVLRSLHIIHNNGIIHGDIKTANILLVDKSDEAEIKIADFGTSIRCDREFVETEHLVGTPWFMAPETLGKKYFFKSDVWSVGILTFQLLSGYFPFNDRNNRHEPSLPSIWFSIFNDNIESKIKAKCWDNVSKQAKDFVVCLLNKNPTDRPTAEEALNHPWLTSSDCQDRFTGKPLFVTPFKYEENARTFR